MIDDWNITNVDFNWVSFFFFENHCIFWMSEKFHNLHTHTHIYITLLVICIVFSKIYLFFVKSFCFFVIFLKRSPFDFRSIHWFSVAVISRYQFSSIGNIFYFFLVSGKYRFPAITIKSHSKILKSLQFDCFFLYFCRSCLIIVWICVLFLFSWLLFYFFVVILIINK